MTVPHPGQVIACVTWRTAYVLPSSTARVLTGSHPCLGLGVPCMRSWLVPCARGYFGCACAPARSPLARYPPIGGPPITGLPAECPPASCPSSLFVGAANWHLYFFFFLLLQLLMLILITLLIAFVELVSFHLSLCELDLNQ